MLYRLLPVAWLAVLSACVDCGGPLPDAGAGDGGALDGGAVDGGASDAGAVDGGPSDAGAIDGGAEDAGADGGGPVTVSATRLPDIASYTECILASPLLATSQGEPFVLVFPKDEGVVALDPANGEEAWRVVFPTPADRDAFMLSTPAIVGDTLFAVYYLVDGARRRLAHRVVAVDLAARALHADYEVVELSASVPAFDGSGNVDFLPSNSLPRSTVKHGVTTARPEGLLYVSFGNAQDIQPWHGWVFELDVEAWRTGGAAAATTGVLLTTPETDCPVEGLSGSRDMICGGGVWAPSGPVVVPRTGTFDLIVPTGNGQLDLNREDYANTLMRTGPGLAFDPACDEGLCADFDELDPAEDCMASCEDLFIPRLAGDPPLSPASGACDGLTFLECYAVLDYDLGANSPAHATLQGGKQVLVLPAKDGAVYLVDYEHMGTLYDREQLMDQCGAVGDTCRLDWAGMFVTQPKLVELDGELIAVVPSFIADQTHPAGVHGLRVTTDDAGVPDLELAWQAPSFDSQEAHDWWRTHPSRATITWHDGEPFAWVVNVALSGSGTLLGIRVRDGEIVAQTALADEGRRFIEPLVHDDVLYTTSCNSNAGPGVVERFQLAPAPD